MRKLIDTKLFFQKSKYLNKKELNFSYYQTNLSQKMKRNWNIVSCSKTPKQSRKIILDIVDFSPFFHDTKGFTYK